MATATTLNAKQQEQQLSVCIDQLKVTDYSDDSKSKLKSWLGKILRIVITDEREVVGSFVCTDRDGNVILENTTECRPQNSLAEPRFLGLALVPGKHIVSVSLYIGCINESNTSPSN